MLDVKGKKRSSLAPELKISDATLPVESNAEKIPEKDQTQADQDWKEVMAKSASFDLQNLPVLEKIENSSLNESGTVCDSTLFFTHRKKFDPKSLFVTGACELNQKIA